MDIEFHYYITYIIGRAAGFNREDAFIIAYSSQYTDDNDTVYAIHGSEPDPYSNYISQTMNILKPQKELMQIYPAFHFMPGTLTEIAGDSARRRDGKLHLMNTRPDNLNSKLLLTAAFDSKNLYRIGIATHMYADTFSHQNFVGFYEIFNNMKATIENHIPSVGHADARYNPDIPGLIWQDERLVPNHSEIDNKKRFLEATRCIYEQYAGYLNTPNDSKDLIAKIDGAIGEHNGSEEDRIDRYRTMIGGEFIEYDERAWFNEAVDFVNEEIKYSGPDNNVPRREAVWAWRGNDKNTHWFKFQEAVKAHQWLAMDLVIGPIIEGFQLSEHTRPSEKSMFKGKQLNRSQKLLDLLKDAESNRVGQNTSYQRHPEPPKLTLKVFICHATEDKPKARDLYRRLVEDGYDAWFDEEKLLPGQHWQLEIKKAVRSSDVFIVLISRKTVSKTGYVQKEIVQALDYAQEQPEGTIFIIPVRLEDGPIPQRLNHLQWVNLFDEDGYERLLRAFRKREEDLATL